MKNELKNSENFIKSKLGKKSSFSKPKDYFDSFEDSFFTKLAEDSFSKENAFKTPNSYFDSLEDSVFSKLESNREVKVISLKKRVLKTIPFAAAASILLFITLNTFVFNNDTNFTIDNLNDSDMEYWLSSNEINDIDIAQVFEDAILDENDFSLTTIKTENIEDYIISIDNSSILNEIP